MDYKASFKKLFDSIHTSYLRPIVWSDFIHMSAYAISNSIDFRQDREAAYMNIVKKYTKEEAKQMAELFAIIVLALEENREQDFLGELYMDYGFSNNDKGEYFTPYHIAKFMAALNTGEEIRDFTSVHDPCCGSGVLLMAYINKLLNNKVDFQHELLVTATDSNQCIALMCYIQLSLLGSAGYICVRDTLLSPLTNNPLIPPDDAFIMPLFNCLPIWKLRKETALTEAAS